MIFSLAEIFQLSNLAGHYSARKRDRQGQEAKVYRFLIVNLFFECYTAMNEILIAYLPFVRFAFRLRAYAEMHEPERRQSLPACPLYR